VENDLPSSSSRVKTDRIQEGGQNIKKKRDFGGVKGMCVLEDDFLITEKGEKPPCIE